MRRRVGVTFRNPEKVKPYEDALRAAGVEPVRISATHPRYSMTGLEGLLLTGGSDLNPKLYGAGPHSETEDVDDARDHMERQLLRHALRGDLPVLAVCRGLQLLNVAHRGRLIQHLPTTATHRRRGVADAHAIEVEPGTRLAGIIGAGEHSVNSRHHQAANPDHIGEGLVVSARASDGVIEGLERPDRRFAVAVQWHPEDRVATHENDRRLFEAFAAAVNSSPK